MTELTWSNRVIQTNHCVSTIQKPLQTYMAYAIPDILQNNAPGGVDFYRSVQQSAKHILLVDQLKYD